MYPSRERLLRPILAFLTLTLAAFLLAPTVSSVHEKVTDLSFDRATPWELFKWTDEPTPTIPFPDCGKKEHQLYSEITQWPARIEKDQAFMLRGVVQSEALDREGVKGIDVDIFLNETKSEPGVFLGEAQSSEGGFFELMTTIPFELKASHYHIVAHAKEKQIDCQFYFEHWSDPETDVVSGTKIEWEPVDHPVAGREMTVRGKLTDDVDAPVRGENVTLRWDGRTEIVPVSEDGTFELVVKPSKPGDLAVVAEFKGGKFYRGTTNETVVDVAREDLEIAATGPIVFARSQPLTLSGHVYVADAQREDEIELRLEGVRVATCLECPANDTIRVPVADDGAWNVSLVVPPSEAPGEGRLVVRGGGLEESYDHDVVVEVPTTLTLHAEGTRLFGKGYAVNATLVDEAGRPLGAPLTLITPDGWTNGTTDANGTISLAGQGTCGRHSVQAQYAGGDHVRPASAEQQMLVCGWLAWVPPWLVATPWWVWPVAAFAAYVAWRLAKGLRQKYAPVISSGPPLTLAFTEPRDDAAGYAGIGEVVVATAFLESPLPDGHSLRMGTTRATEERPLDAELRAHLRIVPEKLGTLPLRAEIVDARGQVVTRRTIHLRVVRYAEEIEARYLSLRAEHGATDDVTPREFEAWLRERAPGLDHEVARRLVHVFEEADYSPRVAGRADYVAYLQAEQGVQEVTSDVPLR